MSFDGSSLGLDTIAGWQIDQVLGRMRDVLGDAALATYLHGSAAGELAPWTSPNPDLAILPTALREDGVALCGPPPAAVVDPIPCGDMERALYAAIPELLPGLTDDVTRNSLLTLAWGVVHARVRPDRAQGCRGDVAIERLGDGAGEALRHARAGYLGEAPDRWDADAIEVAKADAAAILEQIGAPGGSHGAPGT